MGEPTVRLPVRISVRRPRAESRRRELGPDALDVFTGMKNVFFNHG
jgi:hypothetical protein